MADGLVAIGVSRILPPPTLTVENFIRGQAAGGDPGDGFTPPGHPLDKLLYPNGTGNTGFDGLETGDDIPITAREFADLDSALEAAEENTISVDDSNYIEISNGGTPVAAGHRVEYDVSGLGAHHFRGHAVGYGWEDEGPTYQFLMALWNYDQDDYDTNGDHTASEKNGLTKDFRPAAKYTSGGDIVSQLIQGKPWGGGGAQTTYTRTYFARLEVYV